MDIKNNTIKTITSAIFLILSLLFTGSVWAFYSPQVSFQSGYVFSRGIVYGDEGKKTYVEYDQSGKEVGVIGEEQSAWEDAKIISGSQYKLYLDAYDDVMNENPDAVLYGRDAFESANIVTINDEPVNRNTITISENTLAVVILPKEEILLPTTDFLILQLPINPQIRPNPSSKSIFMQKDGTLIAESENNIGVRVSYLVDSSGAPKDDLYFKPGDEAVSPLDGARIDIITPFPLGNAVGTDSRGRYTASYMKICPGFQMEINVHLWLELRYSRFNPQGSDYFPYYLNRTAYDYCSGLSALFAASPTLAGQMAGISIAAIESNISRPYYPVNFPVDIITLNGAALVLNPDGAVSVTESEATKYNAETQEEYKRVAQEHYDFDGDGTDDKSLLGSIVIEQDANGDDIEVFREKPPEEAEIQGVWLSSKHDFNTLNTAEVLPDLTRIPDWSPDLEDRGLLTSLNLDDLQNTDIYLFREADGTLITEQNGLSEDQRENIFLKAGESRFNYTIPIVGGNERFYTAYRGGYLGPGGSDAFKQWQIAGKMDEQFYERDADHLRVGEPVRVIAINRATGYIGSIITNVKSEGIGSFLSFPFEDVEMRPPNLKIWAERKRDIEAGMRKDEELEFSIGNEGAALADDKMIVIYTEWLDKDGYPFPENLGKELGRDYGYTGRIARVSGGSLVAAGVNTGDGQAQFPIAPGRQTQVVRLPEGVLGEQHFHIHVSGEPIIRNPDFSSSGIQTGILNSRPDLYVPVKVKVFNESDTLLQEQAWRLARELPGNEDLELPEPVYNWFYRPDYQFSVYDLEVQEIFSENALEEEKSLFQLDGPVITSTDNFVEMLYSLVAPDEQSLPAYSYQEERELILSLAGEEVVLTVGDDLTVRIDNLDKIANLDPLDYMTFALYSNNDPGNILWEWAFEFLAIDTLRDTDDLVDEEGNIVVTTDDTELPLQAILLGYHDRLDENKEDVSVRWFIDGDGSVSPNYSPSNADGAFNTVLTMPNSVGSEGILSAEVSINGETFDATFGKVIVRAGQPATITPTTTGELTASEYGVLNVSVNINDARGNPVTDGTTVNFSVSGDARLENTEVETINGVATASIKGGSFTSVDNELTISAGDIETTELFSVHPFNVSITAFSASQDIGTVNPVSINVRDRNNNPVSGLTVQISSNYGLVDGDQFETDAAGNITKFLLNPGVPGDAQLTVVAGYATVVQQDYQVTVPAGSGQDNINTHTSMLIGNADADGILTHERFDGTQIDMPYAASTELEVTGNPGEVTTLHLGDLSDQNLSPITAFLMNSLEDDGLTVPESSGLHSALASRVQVVKDNPMTHGSSYYFTKDPDLTDAVDENSFFFSSQIARLENTTDIGFRVDFKPVENGGTVFNYAEGAQSLVLDNTGKLVYTVVTGDGTFSATSNALNLGQWSTVAGSFSGGELVLEVDGVQFSTSGVTGIVDYASTSGLSVGYGSHSYISSLKFFDLSSQPLVVFDDLLDENGDPTYQINANGTASITLDASGLRKVRVKSNNQMNQQEGGSAHKMARVPVSGLSGNRSYISVLSKDYYAEVSGYILDHVAAGAPELQDITRVDYPAKNPFYMFAGGALDLMVPPAQAGFFDWASNVLKVGWEVVNWIVPIEDIGILAQQLYFLATDDPQFDAVQLSLAAIGTISIIPAAKGVKVVQRPLKALITFSKRFNNKFSRAFGSVIGKAVSKAIDSKSARYIIDLLPFLIIAGELMFDSESREGLILLIKTITSDDDLWAWIDYFTLPVEGWIGGETPPKLDLVSNADPDNSFGTLALDFLISPAHAAGNRRAGLLQVRPLLKALKRLENTLASGGDYKKVIQGIKGTTQALKKTDWADIRKVAFSPKTVVFASVAGQNAIRKLFKRARNLRISPFAIAAIVTYLETRKTCTDLPACDTLHPDVAANLDKIYKKAFTQALLDSNKDFVFGWRENGNFFHLAVLAYYHLKYEQGNLEDEQPVAVEEQLRVQLRKYNAGVLTDFMRPYIRNVDIVLRGSGTAPINRVFVETKSYKSPYKPNYYNRWKLDKGKALSTQEIDGIHSSSLHKQFFLDRVATSDSLPDSKRHGSDIRWWFHGFNRRTVKGYNANDLKRARASLILLPHDEKVGSNSLGKNRRGSNPTVGLKSKIDVFNLKGILLDSFKSVIFDGIDDQLYDSLVTNSTHDI